MAIGRARGVWIPGVAKPTKQIRREGQKGDTGSAGPQGAIGATGSAGSVGLSGNTGIQGPQGVQGNTGPAGTNGTNGATGSTGPSSAVLLPNITFGQTAVVAINAGYRTVTASCSGLLAGDRVFVTPTAALPTGYSLADTYCLTNGTLTINVFAPLLVIGANYSITSKVTVCR